MPTDPPDYDPELDAELDRLAAKFPKRARSREIPEDIRALRRAIHEQALLCRVEPGAQPYQLDRFEALDGKYGGMGMVIEARDPKLDRKVAIKLWMTTGADADAALQIEAKTLAKLAHPNVVTVHDTGVWQGRIFFVMEWVDGRDGHDWMTEKAWSWREIRDVFVGAGRGLAAAHDAGIQHRDFKPSNILVGHDGRVRVADFGVADVLQTADGDESSSGSNVGTPTYMAPERLRRERGDARSDQFSFCVALWKALHGVRPYAGETPEELLEYIDSGMIRRSRSAEVPEWLGRVVLQGLDPSPEGRFADMHELVAALLDEPPDAPQASDEPGEDQPDSDVPLLHSPASSSTPTVGRRSYIYGLMTGILAMAVVTISVRLLAPGPADPISEAPVPDASSEPLTDLPPDSISEESTTDQEPIATPEEVIEKIKLGKYDEANRDWFNEDGRRTLLRVPTYADSVRVGEAFLNESKVLGHAGKIEDAKKLADHAGTWAVAAKKDLTRYKVSSRGPEDLLGRTRDYVRSLGGATQSK